MKFATCMIDGEKALAVPTDGGLRGLRSSDERYPGDLDMLVRSPATDFARLYELIGRGERFPPEQARFLIPFTPGKIICIGLNYADHTAESGMVQPDYPTVFGRFASSLVAHDEPLIVPRVSDQFDYEGELVAVIGNAGRHIAKADALDHVCGYSLFNDGSVRDYQKKTPQWTVGKNFDGSGAFGPWFVPSAALPAGGAGLTIETRLNGAVVQSSSTEKLIFDIATLVSVLSEAFTLEPGDIIVSGTPSGVGAARTPPLFMKAGDVCEVIVDQLGTLSNPVAAEAYSTRAAAEMVAERARG